MPAEARLGADELESLRATLEVSLPDSAVRYRNTPTPDGQGGKVDSWSAGPTIPCELFTESRKGEVFEGDVPRAVSIYTVYVAHDADVTAKDRLRIGGVDLEVLTVGSDSPTEALMLELSCWRPG